MDQHPRRPRWRTGTPGGMRRGGGVVALVLAIAGLLTTVVAATALAQPGQPGGSAPAIGTAVPFVGTEGSTLAEITIEAVEDPFQDYDPNSPPERAYHFVLLTVTVENTGNRPFAFDPNAIAIQDADGFLSRPLYLPRSEASLAALPDFPAGEVPPGESATGAIAYQTLNGPSLLNAVYLPASDRLVVLAALAGPAASSTATGDDGAGTTATPSGQEAGPDADAESTPAAGTAASGLDCALAEEWATGTGARLDAVALLVAELETFDRATADPVRLAEIAQEFQTMADDQSAAETPPELAAANDRFVEAYEAFAAAFDLVAGAAEDGDIDAVADEANADAAAANTVFAEAGNLAQAELAACGLS